jgi:hypothetical protein
VRLRDDESGIAYVEFLIAFIPFFVMFLGMIQIALYFSANLLVRHAASTAARAAIVVLPDDPEYYDDEPVNRIEDDVGGGSGPMMVGGMSIPSSSDGSRIGAIRNAASIPLLTMSPSFDELIHDESVAAAVGDVEGRFLNGAAIYNRTAVAVTFPTAPGADTHADSFGLREQVTTRVTYLFHCGVPVVSRIFCDDYISLRTGIPFGAAEDLADAISTGDMTRIRASAGRFTHATARLREEGAGVDELGEAEVPYAGIVYSAFGARFRVIRAEATMTNQGAGFTYE